MDNFGGEPFEEHLRELILNWDHQITSCRFKIFLFQLWWLFFFGGAEPGRLKSFFSRFSAGGYFVHPLGNFGSGSCDEYLCKIILNLSHCKEDVI